MNNCNSSEIAKIIKEMQKRKENLYKKMMTLVNIIKKYTMKKQI